jgi:hypothetical protein
MSITSILKDVAESPVIIAKKIGEVFTIIGKADKVLSTVITEQPEIKLALLSTVNGALAIGGDISTAIAAKGLNWTADTQVVADVEAYFKNTIEGQLVPLIEKLYADIAVDIKTPVASVVAPSAAAIAAGMSPTQATS